MSNSIQTQSAEVEPPAVIESEAEELENEEPEEAEEPVDLQANDEEPEAEAEEPSEDDETEEAEGEGEPQPEFVAVEIDGAEYELPPELAERVWMHKDYTQKSQQNAELRKEYEAKLQSAQQIERASQEELIETAKLITINSELQQYQDVDWQAFQAADHESAQAAWMQYQQLKEKQSEAAGYLQQVRGQKTEMQGAETQTRIQQTFEHAQKQIQGWTPELDAKITQFTETKFPRERIVELLDPSTYEMMHLAYLGHLSLQKQQSAKPKSKVGKAKPLSKVNSKSSPPPGGRVEEIDDMEAYAARRMKQMGYG